MQDLVHHLNSLCDAEPFTTAWYLKDLTSGEHADRDGAVVVPSASTRKISIMMAALKAVNEGRLSLGQPVIIQAKYQDNDSGTFQHLTPGFTIPFKDILVMMIIVSDNTCTGTVVEMVGLDEINALCRSIGMLGTAHRFGIPPRNLDPDHPVDAVTTTTPNDVGLLLELILPIDILSWQKLRTRLPSLLPLATKVAHKTGTGARGYHDAGIVYKDDRPLFILTAYTDQVPRELADGTPGFAAAAQLIGRLGRACYDALAERSAIRYQPSAAATPLMADS